MLMQVALLVFLFLARLSFPRTKSVAPIIGSRYGEKGIKSIRKFKNMEKRVSNLFENLKNWTIASEKQNLTAAFQ